MDKEKVIKGLEHCIRESEHIDDNPCDGCPYFVSDQYGCERTQMEKDALALLKEQEAQKFFVDESGKITPLPVVVRCKDCKWRGNKKKCIVAFVADKQEFPIFFYDNRGNWFCADGERRNSDA